MLFQQQQQQQQNNITQLGNNNEIRTQSPPPITENKTVAEPDRQIRVGGGGGGYPDPGIKRGGAGRAISKKKKCFRPFVPQFGLKIRWGAAPRAPFLDPPLQENENERETNL